MYSFIYHYTKLGKQRWNQHPLFEDRGRKTPAKTHWETHSWCLWTSPCLVFTTTFQGRSYHSSSMHGKSKAPSAPPGRSVDILPSIHHTSVRGWSSNSALYDFTLCSFHFTLLLCPMPWPLTMCNTQYSHALSSNCTKNLNFKTLL